MVSLIINLLVTSRVAAEIIKFVERNVKSKEEIQP